MIGEKVFTPYGQGRIVYRLPDETILIEYEGGWGKVVTKDEIFSPDRESQPCRKRRMIDSWQRCAG